MSHLIFVEAISAFLFLWGLRTVKRDGPGRTLEYVMMFFYGIILEELDMLIFKTYHYSNEFLLNAWHAPISIALLWAVILAGAMAVSDRLALPEAVRPFMDAILAVWIDLALDAIAIRLHYWTWIIPLNEGWFGVPAGNLYAWMWVAFSYSALARWVRRGIAKTERWKWAYAVLPMASYVLLFVAMNSVGFVGKLFNLETQNERLIIFWVQLFIFVLIVASFWMRGKPTASHIPGVWLWSRLAIHLYFLAVFFIFGFYRNVPVLGLVAFVILAVEMLFFKRLVPKAEVR